MQRLGLQRRPPLRLLTHSTRCAPHVRRESTLPAGDATILESSKPTSIDISQSQIPDNTQHGAFFVQDVLPSVYGKWDARSRLFPTPPSAVASRMKDLFSQIKLYNFNVVNVDPTPKDGGVFVNFTFTPKGDTLASKTVDEIEAALRVKIDKDGGIPTWYGDLNVFPSSILKVEFEGPDVHHEVLYDILRPYGRIKDMTKPTPVPAGSLRFVLINFSRSRSAILARNCLHGIGVADNTLTAAGTTGTPTKTRLSIAYEAPIQAHAIRDWMSAHPRIVLPIAAFLLGSLTYTVFDPIRSFFIKLKVLGWLDYHGQIISLYLTEKALTNDLICADFKIVHFFRQKVLDEVTFSTKSKDDQGGQGEFDGDTATAQPGPHGSIATTSDEWKERVEAENALYAYLAEAPSTISIIHGPAGSGKSKMLAKVMENVNRKVVHINCAELEKAGSDSAMILALARQTGYWPIFSFLTSMNNMIDLASVGLIGQKAGFSTSTEVQLKEILEVVGGALKQVSAELAKEQKKKDARAQRAAAPIPPPKMEIAKTPDPIKLVPSESEKIPEPQSEKDPSILKTFSSSVTTSVTSSVSVVTSSVSAVTSSIKDAKDNMQDYLATKGILGEKAAEEQAVEDWKRNRNSPTGRLMADDGVNALPIVVLHDFGGSKDVMLTVLATWAAALVDNGVAHVIAVSDNRENMRRLAKALPTMPLLSVPLGDADPVIALGFVKKKMPKDIVVSPEDETWIGRLGGRANDLDALVHKVQNGSTVRDAVEDIIARGVGELRKIAFGDDVEDTKNLPWKQEQAWAVLKRLAKDDEISYADVLLEFPFKGDESSLREMEHAELITIATQDGLPIAIRPGKPVYRYVFQRLANDRIFNAVQDIAYSKSAIAAEEAAIRKIEEELIQLKTIGLNVGNSILGGSGATASRAGYLLAKMKKSQETLDGFETEIKRLKQVLHTPVKA
ncbi:mitochondrial escape protein 2 [Tulasnella sp. 331]|nr:mitochondrial escape protein 2 [Tulasnella sp. 331]